MPRLKRATTQLHKLGPEAQEFYVSKGLWGYAVMPEGRLFTKVSTAIHDTAQEAIDAFQQGERPTIAPLGTSKPEK